MGYNSYINGSIDGISEDSFELIKEDLEEVFGDVYWNNNEIDINSYGKHCDEVVFPVYDKIAFCIDGSGGGQLDVEGDEHDDLSSIFFVQRQWKQVWAEIEYPENPFINKSINITYVRVARVYVKPSILEEIRNEFSGWVNGKDTGNWTIEDHIRIKDIFQFLEDVCITKDDLGKRITTGDIKNKELFQFLKTVQNELTMEVEDIVFHN